MCAEWLRVWRENKQTEMICALQQEWRLSRGSSPVTENSPYAVVNSRTDESLINKTENDIEKLELCKTMELQPIAKNLKEGLTMKNHILLSITYTLQQFISLMLMLVFMTFNLYLCITIAFGHGLGKDRNAN